MSAVGLTKAMRAALENKGAVPRRTFDRARRLGLLGDIGLGVFRLTPRGHAALAAPRMTQGEYDVLTNADQLNFRPPFSPQESRIRWSLINKLWMKSGEGLSDWLTPSGLKALNDVRAATGSELYKDNMP